MGGTSTPAIGADPSAPSACELLEVERVAAGLVVDGVGARSDQLARLLPGHGAECETDERAVAVRAVERAGETGRELPGPRRHGDQDAGRGRPVQERHQEVDRRRVGPVQVVQRQHERLGGGELLEQLDHRAVDAVALVQGRPLRRPGFRQRGQDLAELRAHRRVEPFQPAGVEALDVPVEGVDEDPERKVLLELGR